MIINSNVNLEVILMDKSEVPSLPASDLKVKLQIKFPSFSYAEAAMNTIAVDPPFQDSKTKKTSIKREMAIHSVSDEQKQDGEQNLVIVFSANQEEVNSLRTCISSFVANMTLVCQTIKEFAN